MLIAILYARKLRPIVCVRLKVSELNWPGEIKKYRNFDIDDFQDFENHDFLIFDFSKSRYRDIKIWTCVISIAILLGRSEGIWTVFVRFRVKSECVKSIS